MSEQDPWKLDVEAVKERQQRLVDRMDQIGAEVTILRNSAHIQWLVGAHFRWLFEPVAAIRKDGHVTVVMPVKPPLELVADEVHTYEAQWHSTLRNDQTSASTEKLFEHLPGSLLNSKVAVEFSTGGASITGRVAGELIDIDPHLYYLRRRKSRDELAYIRHAIAATEKMYERAREMIRPGMYTGYAIWSC